MEEMKSNKKWIDTTWKPHEREWRELKYHYENDTLSTHIRAYKVYGEASTSFISKGGLPFRDGSTDVAIQAQYE